MICERCDQPILPGQPSTTLPVDSASTARADVTIHAEPCQAPPHQTAPQLTRSQQLAEERAARMARIRRYDAPY
ncbi:hypothetical protein ABZ446_01635 [Streptomyces sp. NPDC005813]|uniref:hypothetical protein n=1 Tax=Streptomyces sp. NPDC005813 TaxID=3155592 RepID=UPI0033C2F0A4